MSRRYKGGVISATAPVPTGPFQCGTAKGIWTLPQQMQARAANIWPIAGNVVPGSNSYITAGTFSWVAPAGVSSVSVVVVGPAFTGTGGALAYTNNISVTAGSSYTVRVLSESIFCGAGYTRSYFINECTVSAAFSSLRTGTGGGNGVVGGAGGYSGDGGLRAAAGSNAAGSAGTGGGGGGGGAGPNVSPLWLGASGGVGLFGQGSNGAGGAAGGGGGGGGSGGTSGAASNACAAGAGGLYGGGAGLNTTIGNGTIGASAVRIVWPGNTRTFPSTCVGAP